MERNHPKLMPESYRKILATRFSRQELAFLEILVCQLQIYTKVTVEGLAARLPLLITFESRRRRIQRFLALDAVTIQDTWFALWTVILPKVVSSQAKVCLALDRTQWKNRNLFFISLIVDKRAYPLNWLILDKEGASNLDEQKALIHPVLHWLSTQIPNPIVVLGDREFHSVQLAGWLGEQGIHYVLREKKDLQVKGKDGQYSPVESQGIYPGMKRLIAPVVVVKSKGFGEGNLAIRWKKKYRGKGEKEAWYLLSNLDDVDEIIECYSKRMGIEEMFRDVKKGGYNLEDCKARPERLNNLMLVISIAYTLSSLKGKAIRKKRQGKYVGRQRTFHKKRTKNSDFKVGLYGQLFCDLPQELMVLGRRLMELTPSKRLFYWRGEMARREIQQAF